METLEYIMTMIIFNACIFMALISSFLIACVYLFIANFVVGHTLLLRAARLAAAQKSLAHHEAMDDSRHNSFDGNTNEAASIQENTAIALTPITKEDTAAELVPVTNDAIKPRVRFSPETATSTLPVAGMI